MKKYIYNLPKHHLQRSLGYTLLEMLLVLLTLLILLLCGSVSYFYSIKRNTLQTAKASVISTVNYARLLSLSTQRALMLTGREGSWEKGLWLCPYHKSYSCNSSNLMFEQRWSNKSLIVEWRGFQSKAYLLFNASPIEMAVNGYFTLRFNELECKIIVNRLGSTRESSC